MSLDLNTTTLDFFAIEGEIKIKKKQLILTARAVHQATPRRPKQPAYIYSHAPIFSITKKLP